MNGICFKALSTPYQQEKKRDLDYSIVPSDVLVSGMHLGIVPISFEAMDAYLPVDLLVLPVRHR